MSGDEQPAATPGDDPTPAVHSDQWVPPESVRPAAPAVPVPSTAPVPPRDPVPPKDPVHPATAASSPTDGGVMTDVVASGTGQPDSDASPKKPARRVTGRRSSERRLAYWLIAPAAVVMALVTGYPIVYAFWLSLNKSTLTAPDEQEFVWFSNYATVLSAGFWWSAFGITAFLTLVSVIIELALGLAIALLMHRTIFGKGVVRTVVLIPYGIVTVAAAISWKYAWTTDTGYLANLLPDGSAPLTQQWPSLFIIILAEVWKTTPFMALLLLAGLALVPDDLLKAAQLDGAGAWTRLRRIIIPMMKPAILVALLFRTLDAFRIFDNIYVLTAGSNGTASVSMLGYDNLFKAFNLGVGSAISILIFLAVALIAFVFIKGFGTAAPGSDDEGR
ncbi:ABC transporter permease subunit [Gordonia shandongensis]|uniref:ABC transporter permease subunit n=1 Tax=Gordonia shandongensis TaxID=376351 RepID=UPI000A06D577|nr:ABC transporter permease subunit [Gordonia shandongensis]